MWEMEDDVVGQVGTQRIQASLPVQCVAGCRHKWAVGSVRAVCAGVHPSTWPFWGSTLASRPLNCRHINSKGTSLIFTGQRIMASIQQSIRGIRISTDIAASTSPPSIPIVPPSCRRRRQPSHQTLTIESTRRLGRRLGPAHYTSDLPIQSKSTPYQFTTTQQCGSEHNPTTLKTQREKTHPVSLPPHDAVHPLRDVTVPGRAVWYIM